MKNKHSNNKNNDSDIITETLLYTNFDSFVNESFDKNRRVFSADLDSKGKVQNMEVTKILKDDNLKDFTYKVKKIPSTAIIQDTITTK